MLKKFIIALIVLGLFARASVQGQHPFFIQVTELPPMTLGLAEVIDILADYNLKHIDSRDFGWIGLTVPQSRNIYIYDKMSQADKRTTLLHELLHAAYYQKNVQTGDQYSDMLIEQKAEELYGQLYGFPVMPVNPDATAPVEDPSLVVEPQPQVDPQVAPLPPQRHIKR